MIEIGETRIVIILPFLGIVIKIARIRLISCFKIHRRYFFGKDFAPEYKPYRQRLRMLRDRWSRASYYNYSPRWHLFAGSMSNLREYRLSRKLDQLNLLAPTFFSLWGLVNIQAYTKRPPQDPERHMRIWKGLLDISERDFFKDAHHWADETEGNIGLWRGYLVMHDYGGFFTGPILKRHGKKIKEVFLTQV